MESHIYIIYLPSNNNNHKRIYYSYISYISSILYYISEDSIDRNQTSGMFIPHK